LCCIMTKYVLLLTTSALLGCSRASSDGASTTASALSTFEQYCFPRSGGPFSNGTILQSITMIYSGLTLTTTPVTVTFSGAISTAAPVGVSSTGGSVASLAASGVQTGILSPTLGRNGTDGEASSRSSASGRDSSLRSSFSSIASQGTMMTSPLLVASSNTVTAKLTSVTGNSNSFAAVPGRTVASGNTTDTSRNGWTSSTRALPTALTGVETGGNASDANRATTFDSSVPAVTAVGGASSSGSDLTPTAAGNNSSLMNQTQAQAPASTSLSTPAGSTPRPASSSENATISLSPSAVDALQLAQFLKNLGVSVLNTSKLYTRRSTEANYGASSLASLVADISEQEQMQLEALQTLLRRSGGEHVPPCQYSAPGNATELVTLMAVLKSIELGVFMSLAESLPPTDTPATVLLSSMASVASKQNALLHTHTVSNASIESFETPSSAAWAYNLALGYVQPGSCAVELPLPILPTLTMNDRTVGYARPGTEVTFSW
ncbi:hypothetical protein PMIN02_013054, partial [Paraphaeosphaeria minitans]